MLSGRLAQVAANPSYAVHGEAAAAGHQGFGIESTELLLEVLFVNVYTRSLFHIAIIARAQFFVE